MSTTVSAKIPKHLRERLRENGVDVSVVIRKALEKEVIQREQEELKIKLVRLNRLLSGRISHEEVVRTIRSSREER